jgi:hypothetical protein
MYFFLGFLCLPLAGGMLGFVLVTLVFDFEVFPRRQFFNFTFSRFNQVRFKNLHFSISSWLVEVEVEDGCVVVALVRRLLKESVEVASVGHHRDVFGLLAQLVRHEIVHHLRV